jgi:RecB family exonuclease
MQLAGAPIRWRAERLLEHDTSRLAGRNLSRQQTAIWGLPQLRAGWTFPSSAMDRLAGRVESATSFERLVDCQLRWLLSDVLRLRRGRFAEIPGPDQLLGSLAHAIVRRVLQPDLVIEPDAIRQAVEAAFDEIVTAIAAPLLQPEYAGELAVARSRIPAAVAHLARMLRSRGLAVVETEANREAVFADGLHVRGRLDLIVRHPTRGLGVIDLKWNRNAKRRRQEIADGRALQLATYGAIADPDGGVPVPGAYYLLRQRRLLGERGSIVAEEELDALRTLPATWDDLVATWRSWRDLAQSGTALASGGEGAAANTPPDVRIHSSEEPCRYCEFTSLCRIGAEEV